MRTTPLDSSSHREMEKEGCLSFSGLPHNASQTRWLKTTGTYCLPVLEARSTKSMLVGPCFLLQKNLRQAFSLTSAGCRKSWACGNITPVSGLCLYLAFFSLCLLFPCEKSLSPFSRTLVIGFKAHPNLI